jgi:hypothetical protein
LGDEAVCILPVHVPVVDLLKTQAPPSEDHAPLAQCLKGFQGYLSFLWAEPVGTLEILEHYA